MAARTVTMVCIQHTAHVSILCLVCNIIDFHAQNFDYEDIQCHAALAYHPAHEWESGLLTVTLGIYYLVLPNMRLPRYAPFYSVLPQDGATTAHPKEHKAGGRTSSRQCSHH